MVCRHDENTAFLRRDTINLCRKGVLRGGNHVCVCVCVCVYIYIYIYICVYVCACVREREKERERERERERESVYIMSEKGKDHSWIRVAKRRQGEDLIR